MKRIQPVILLLAAMTLFLFYRQSHRQSFTEGITRAQTARMLAWTVCDMNKDRAKSVDQFPARSVHRLIPYWSPDRSEPTAY